MSIKWIGLDAAKKAFHSMPGDAMKGIKAGLVQEAETIMTKSKRITPVDDGHLKNSGFVDRPKVKGAKATIELGYGGAASEYALAVHEHPSEHSPPSWANGVTFNVGGPKFLEKPVNDAEKGFNKRMGKHVERAIKRGM